MQDARRAQHAVAVGHDLRQPRVRPLGGIDQLFDGLQALVLLELPRQSPVLVAVRDLGRALQVGGAGAHRPLAEVLEIFRIPDVRRIDAEQHVVRQLGRLRQLDERAFVMCQALARRLVVMG